MKNLLFKYGGENGYPIYISYSEELFNEDLQIFLKDMGFVKYKKLQKENIKGRCLNLLPANMSVQRQIYNFAPCDNSEGEFFFTK